MAAASCSWASANSARDDVEGAGWLGPLDVVPAPSGLARRWEPFTDDLVTDDLDVLDLVDFAIAISNESRCTLKWGILGIWGDNLRKRLPARAPTNRLDSQLNNRFSAGNLPSSK
jgi:hypothetical protein